jgi:hypothetical protein
MLNRLAIAAAALVGWSAAAAAQAPPQTVPRRVPHTVTELANVCGIPEGSPDRTIARYFCGGFLAGASQFHGALYPVGGPRQPMFCPPDPPPSLPQAMDAFVAWARANPQFGNETAVDGLIRFAAQTYPCPPEAPRARRRGG